LIREEEEMCSVKRIHGHNVSTVLIEHRFLSFTNVFISYFILLPLQHITCDIRVRFKNFVVCEGFKYKGRDHEC
jgi:hypothetical protein